MGASLSQKDLMAVLDFVAELHVLREPAALTEFLTAALPRLIPSELASYIEFDPKTRGVTGSLGHDPKFFARYADSLARHIHEHPALPAYAKGAGAAARITDFISQGRFRRSAYYSEVFHPLRMEYSISKGLPVPGARIGAVSLLRSALEFSGRDSLVLSLLRNNLNQAYRNAETYSKLVRQALSSSAPPADGSRPSLSQREAEVLIWASRGRGNRDIGSILGISELTVKKHLENIYDKLGAANRMEAVRLVAGLVQPVNSAPENQNNSLIRSH